MIQLLHSCIQRIFDILRDREFAAEDVTLRHLSLVGCDEVLHILRKGALVALRAVIDEEHHAALLSKKVDGNKRIREVLTGGDAHVVEAHLRIRLEGCSSVKAGCPLHDGGTGVVTCAARKAEDLHTLRGEILLGVFRDSERTAEDDDALEGAGGQESLVFRTEGLILLCIEDRGLGRESIGADRASA